MRAGYTGGSGRAGRTVWAGYTLHALGTRRAGRTVWAGYTLHALGASWASGASCTPGAGWARGTCGTSRTYSPVAIVGESCRRKRKANERKRRERGENEASPKRRPAD